MNDPQIMHRARAACRFAICALALIVCASHALAETPTAAGTHAVAFTDQTIKTFFADYCVECHGPEKQKGDRRFDQFAFPVQDEDTLIDLHDILDQLNLGDMPPKKAKQPDEAVRRGAVEWLMHTIDHAHAQRTSTGGRTVLRRLNRREYLNTLADLFDLNMAMFDPTTKFPRDQTIEHMDNIGDTLVTSGYLLDQYLDAADQIVEKALRVMERPKEQSWKFDGNFHQQPELRYSHGKVFNYRYMCLYEVNNTVNHEGGYGAITGFEEGVPADGFYEIKVLAHARNRRHPYDPNIFHMDPDEPFRLGVVPGDHTAGPLHHTQPIEPLLAEVVVTDDDEPQWYTMKVWLDAGYTPRFTFPNGMVNCRRVFGQLLNKYRHLLPEHARKTRGIVETRRVILQYGHMPHIRIHEIQIRGPFYETWPLPSYRAIVGDEPFAPERIREIIECFASRAYRRPVRADELDRLLAIVDQRRADGRSPFDAMKDALKAVLCSPAFLYLVEPELEAELAASSADSLPAHALATRLSYFLWSTMPDEQLRGAADSGQILNDDVLLEQTRRMLANERSDAFIIGFLDSWLNLRSLGDMPPDRDAFERYYSKELQTAMRRETQLFTRHLIDENKSIIDMLDCDYTFVNKPLAQLYGIADGMSGEGAHLFRRVTLDDPNRGGLLGHASVLTVTANGIETSPVTRGVWLLENILGTPPAPPPDDVPAIDPDVRGATSIRDVLSKHRNTPACYECHQKIDPLGFALENFDPVGSWRTRYPNKAPIEPAGELPDGSSFDDVAGLKKILVERKDQFARTVTERLLSYACGRRMEPLDRPQVDRIVAEFKARGYGFRDLIELVILSETFRSK